MSTFSVSSLPSDVRDALRDASECTGAPPREIVEQALRSYFRARSGGDSLAEKARRQSLRARRADREATSTELDAWEENADTSGWKA